MRIGATNKNYYSAKSSDPSPGLRRPFILNLF